MSISVRYLTHPQVCIEPLKNVRQWSLSPVGIARVSALAATLGPLTQTHRVISSGETKALETAAPLARALGVKLEVCSLMHEHDRSATGFLPPEEFEKVANEFFAKPSKSARGWERADDAQWRIVSLMNALLEGSQDGDVLIVGHGGVGTLLYCALSGINIDRHFDQGLRGGGCWFQFDLKTRMPHQGWQPMETLMIGS